ncbi:hypothetical protein FB565_006009 [Actinoplanes lutulentus]|uniref:hypothetical protein n=1 Tax=Actinoplanes lutulentus TaxID=1287878 RepID=UPI0011B942C1|nr:hypothetical protein [Actinoplanes lutulentus]MBB2946251.1 hypothetical protein [Actinoplanes lutulentus]
MQKVIRSAVAPVEEAAGVQVFVDSTGRRKRLLAVLGFFVALFAAIYIGVVGASVVQAADSGLSTKASVSTSATASASASASSSSS